MADFCYHHARYGAPFLGTGYGVKKHSRKEHTPIGPDLWVETLESGGRRTERSLAQSLGGVPTLQGSFSWSLESSQEEHDASCPPVFSTAGLSRFPSSGHRRASSLPCLKTSSQSHCILPSWLSLNLKTSTCHVPSHLL